MGLVYLVATPPRWTGSGYAQDARSLRQQFVREGRSTSHRSVLDWAVPIGAYGLLSSYLFMSVHIFVSEEHNQWIRFTDRR
jgi:hypothetical protein